MGVNTLTRVHYTLYSIHTAADTLTYQNLCWHTQTNLLINKLACKLVSTLFCSVLEWASDHLTTQPIAWRKLLWIIKSVKCLSIETGRNTTSSPRYHPVLPTDTTPYRERERFLGWPLLWPALILAAAPSRRTKGLWAAGSRYSVLLDAPHKAAATGLWLEHQCGPRSSCWEGCKLRPTPSQGSASTLKNRARVKEMATMNT